MLNYIAEKYFYFNIKYKNYYKTDKMNSVKKILFKYLHFNYIVIFVFCVFLIFFQVKSPLSILSSSRSVTVNSINPNTKNIELQFGNDLETKIVKYINDHFFIQNPDCDLHCADNCIKQSTKKHKGNDFSKNYFEACLVEDCSCEMSSENKAGGFNLLIIVMSLVLTYLVVLLSTNPPNKSLLLGYNKLFDFENLLDNEDQNGLDYELL